MRKKQQVQEEQQQAQEELKQVPEKELHLQMMNCEKHLQEDRGTTEK